MITIIRVQGYPNVLGTYAIHPGVVRALINAGYYGTIRIFWILRLWLGAFSGLKCNIHCFKMKETFEARLTVKTPLLPGALTNLFGKENKHGENSHPERRIWRRQHFDCMPSHTVSPMWNSGPIKVHWNRWWPSGGQKVDHRGWGEEEKWTSS